MTAVDLGAGALGLIMTIGLLSGAASMWLFRRFTDAAALRVAMNRVMAHLLEFQLFSDEPVLILRAQRSLLAANARFLRIIAIPTLLLVVPYALLLALADGLFSRAPLQTGQAALVTLRYEDSNSSLPVASLELPAGMNVETAPVRIANLRQSNQWQISWRIRAAASVSGQLRASWNGRVLTRAISSAPGLHWLPERGPISIGYPPATILNVNWLLWFCVSSAIGSWLLIGMARARASRAELGSEMTLGVDGADGFL